MPIATLSDAPHFEAGAIRFRPLAVPSRGSTELSAWRAELAAGATSGVHSLDHEQLLVVSVGAVTLYTLGTAVTAAPGDTLILPKDTPVELRNETSEPAAATVISPAGFRATVGAQTFSPPWSL